MLLRRLAVAATVLAGLCVLGFAHSGEGPNPSAEPVRVETGEGGNHDEAEARFRSNQSRHWRHVAVGNYASNR
jgi:hypothetical protein